jgi:ABC-type branched-subunit amino acid transport system ATPase component
VVGALAFFGAPELLHPFARWRLVVYGLALIALMVFAPQGLTGLLAKGWERLTRRWRPTSAQGAHAAVLPELAHAGDSLLVDDVSRQFGGVTALDQVSILIEAGTVHAIVGPNGSGKTTLLNIISGFYAPSSGRVVLGGDDVTGASASERARGGVARTFQTPKLVADLPVRDNVMLGSYTERASSTVEVMLRLPRARREERERAGHADDLLAFVGLASRADDLAGELPHGHQRLVEIARALAGRPRLLLLDEPAAGLSLGELDRLAELMAALRSSGLSVVVVEHHLDLVRTSSDAVTVLDQGKVVASGTPDAVFLNEDVRLRYLGAGAA